MCALECAPGVGTQMTRLHGLHLKIFRILFICGRRGLFFDLQTLITAQGTYFIRNEAKEKQVN